LFGRAANAANSPSRAFENAAYVVRSTSISLMLRPLTAEELSGTGIVSRGRPP
jgi:hypothetical protein